jgi:prepilin-type processing-associated H-X9-DG protein
MAARKANLVGLGRLGKSADLSHELQRRGANFFFGDGRVEVK